MTKEKIYVAMSGGVDSSVSAALLKEDGFDAYGVYMKNWTEDIGASHCPWKEDLEDARASAEAIGISFDILNLQKQYKEIVVDYLIQGYKRGETPNPDIMCNQEIKFKLFLEICLSRGADYIATGHYARISKTSIENREAYSLQKAKDSSKDQTYFLHRINQYQLSKTKFPVGGFLKSEVRALAKNFRLPNAEKKDSQGLCFVGNVDFHEFLKQYLPLKRGDILTKSGKLVGEHEGVWFYTIGQRHGIGVYGGGMPYFVIAKDFDKNLLIVGAQDEKEDMYSQTVFFENPHWIAGAPPAFPTQCFAMIRYRETPSLCVVTREESQRLCARFSAPQRAVAAGQYIVFYQGEECLGGGIIVRPSI